MAKVQFQLKLSVNINDSREKLARDFTLGDKYAS